MSRTLRLLILATTVAVVVTSNGRAGELTVSLTNTALDTHAPGDSTLGDYYTLQFAVPAGVTDKELLAAFLEFYADVSARAIGDEGTTVNEAPVLEVYALTGSYRGTLDPTDFKQPSVSREDVKLGNSQLIRIDVTEIVAYYIENPTENYGFILGSLTGVRDGVFEIKDDTFPNGACAQLTFHYVGR